MISLTWCADGRRRLGMQLMLEGASMGLENEGRRRLGGVG